MAKEDFDWFSIAVRLVFAVLLVFSTYNPEGFSYYHWAILNIHSDTPAKVFSGVVLLIGWTIYLRATFHALGFFGLVLAVAFFTTLAWLLIDYGLIPTDSIKAVTYVVLIIISWILTTGISWSFIRRKFSGQYDVVEADEEQQ